MPRHKTAKPRTTRAPRTEESSSNRKPSTQVADTQAETAASGLTTNSPAVTLANPEVTSPTKPTTSTVLATITDEVIVATQIKPLFFADQPSRRAVPALTPDDYQALKANIQELGRILVPITITATGVVIDGYARLQIASELNLFCPWIVENIGEDQISSLARTLNLARRQMNAEQKRQLIAAELIEDAEAAKSGEDRRSFNTIAKKLGVACNTVIKVSQGLISDGKITPITEAIGADGKLRSTPKPRNPKPKAITATQPETSPETADAATNVVTTAAKATDAPAASATTPAASTAPPATAAVPVEPGMPRIFEPGPALAATATEPEPVPAKIPDDLEGDDHAGFDRGGFADEVLARPAGRGDQPPGAFTRIVLDWLRELRLAETDLYEAIKSGEAAVTLDSIDAYFLDHPDALPAVARFDVATSPANA